MIITTFSTDSQSGNKNNPSTSTENFIRTIEYFTTSISSFQSIDEILEDIAKNLASLLQLPDIVIYMVDENSRLLTQKVAFGHKNRSGGSVKNPLILRIGQGIVGSVAVSGKAEIIPNTDLDSRYIADQEKSYSEIAVPIVVDKKVIGVIDSEHPQKNFFNENHLRLLTSVSKLCTDRISKLKTEEKLRLAEHKAKRNEDLLESTQKLLKIGSWEWDLKTDEVIWSDYLYEMFSVNPEIYPVSPFQYLNRIHPDDFKLVYDQVQLCIHQGKSYQLEHRIVCADGSTKTIFAVGEAHRDASGHVVRLMGTAQDITEKNKIENERNYHEALLKAMFDESPDALFLTTVSPKNILQVNKRAAEMFEMDDETEFIGKFGPHFHKIPWTLTEFEMLNKSLDEKNFWTSEIEYLTKHGNTFWGSITIKRLHIQSDWYELVRVVDITKRKSLEFQLIQAQKMESIGTIAGGIAHDFNNLLTMMMGTSELIGNLTTDPKIKLYSERILEAGEKGASIAKQLLLFAKPEASELKPISLSHIVLQVEHMLDHFLPKNIRIETETNLTNGIVNGDSGHLYQVLLNLAINGADAMPNGGKLLISQRNVRLEELSDRFPDADRLEYVALSVSDNGTGMPKHILDRIFDPFFTTKDKGKGTGLGLSIVHGIVKSHHGFIDVESKEGAGTTFTIYIPVVYTDFNPDELLVRRQTETDLTTEKLTILVVDDEKMIRETLVDYLKSLGHDVLISDDGVNALYLFKKRRMSIDCIVTDLGMPRMGGEEFIDKVFATNPNTKIIVTSGYLDKSPKTELIRKGVFEVITKPYKFDELKSVISKITASKKSLPDRKN